jgi:hypothetical protein
MRFQIRGDIPFESTKEMMLKQSSCNHDSANPLGGVWSQCEICGAVDDGTGWRVENL